MCLAKFEKRKKWDDEKITKCIGGYAALRCIGQTSKLICRRLNALEEPAVIFGMPCRH
jgi:hypothetical protein